MVVVFDVDKAPPIVSEERDSCVEDPLLPTSSPISSSIHKGKKRRRTFLRQRRWWIRIAFVVFGLIFVRAVLIKRNEKDFEFLQTLIEENAKSHKGGFGCLESRLKPEKAEKLFLSVPSEKNALDASRKYATHPHLAGTAEDFEDAKVILQLFQEQFGIPLPEKEPIFSAGSPESRKATLDIPSLTSPHAWIDVYYPIMNTPINKSLEIIDEDGSVIWTAELEEDGDPRDPGAAKYKTAVPTFHGYSKDGEAEGKLVYANYGRKEDYEALVADGVDLTGKIVMTRYNQILRGLKIKGAQELGAAGVLIYDDPRNDGAVTVENGYAPYPEGPARNPTSVQRGSVQFISSYPGDPSTPGYPAYENVTRVESLNTPSIPSLPLSWRNAERLLEEIGSSSENRLLNGKASKRKVRIVNHVDDKVTPIWNSMAVIPGHIKDEVIIIGNHRDAWVMGAADPVSGTVSLHEVIRGFGALLRSGWKPLRTILIATWDAEEYGLVGSTEWGEDFEEWISSHAVAYLNIDMSVEGSQWFAAASPSLSSLIIKTAKEIPHPTKPGKSLWDAGSDSGPFEGPIDPEVYALYNESSTKRAEQGIFPLGSGSDFTVFLQRIGIASMDQSFTGTPYDAAYHYHSIYDSQRWMELYSDPGFHKHVAVAKNLGLLALRLADSIILPLNTTQYALQLDEYLDEVESIASSLSLSPRLSPLRKSIKKLQKASNALDKEKYKAELKFRELLERMKENASRIHSHRPHGHHDENSKYEIQGVLRKLQAWFKDMFHIGGHRPHHGQEQKRHQDEDLWDWLDDDDEEISDSPIDHSDSNEPLELSKSSSSSSKHLSLGHTLDDIPIRKFIAAAKRVRRVNKKLASFEKGFISEGGIKDREWYKHLVVAPGKWTGYGATTLPALTEALTEYKNVTLAELEADRLKNLFDKITVEIFV